MVIGVTPDSYNQYQNLKEIILNLSENEANKLGFSRRNMFYLKKKVKDNGGLILKKKTINKLLNI